MSSGRPDSRHRLEQGQQVLELAELLLVEEDVGIGELDDHLLGVGDEIRREIAAVELHALDQVELEGQAGRLLDADHAFLADLVHRLGDHVADLGIAIGRDGADLGDLLRARDRPRPGREVLDDPGHRQLDAALQIHRVGAGGDRLHPLVDDRLGEHGGGGGAVAGMVGGARRDDPHHLRAHVGELVLELDLLGDGHSVLGDPGRAPALVEQDVAALGSERHLDRVGEDIDSAHDPFAGLAREAHIFGCHDLVCLSWRTLRRYGSGRGQLSTLLGGVLIDVCHTASWKMRPRVKRSPERTVLTPWLHPGAVPAAGPLAPAAR